MVASFGAAVVPDKKTQGIINDLNKHVGSLSPGKYTPVFRRGGIYGLFNSRGVTWGRNLVVPRGDRATYVHEYVHYLQQFRDGWSVFQGKSIYNIGVLETILRRSPYNIPGNYEFEADMYEYLFNR